MKRENGERVKRRGRRSVCFLSHLPFDKIKILNSEDFWIHSFSPLQIIEPGYREGLLQFIAFGIQ